MRHIFIAIAFIAAVCSASADSFERVFADTTVCIDLHIARADGGASVAFDSVWCTPHWWGRRVNMDSLHYPDKMHVKVYDDATGKVIYHHSKYMNPGNPHAPSNTTLQIPMSRQAFRVEAVSYFMHDDDDMDSIVGVRHFTPDEVSDLPVFKGDEQLYEYVRRSSYPTPITLAFVAEGYTQDEMPKFLAHAHQLDSALFAQKAFERYADRFNIVAIKLPSAESGISRPSKGIKVNTALDSHFDSFSLDRLLTIPSSQKLWHAVTGLPNTHVIILANSDIYGGSGGYNDCCLGSAGCAWWCELVTHELGHSFAQLGDEYEAGYDITYTSDEEPVEPNITTLCDFSGKWADLIAAGQASLIEGAGYQSKGVWRGCEHCLMRAVDDRYFCPVCTEAVAASIRFYTEPLK